MKCFCQNYEKCVNISFTFGSKNINMEWRSSTINPFRVLVVILIFSTSSSKAQFNLINWQFTGLPATQINEVNFLNSDTMFVATNSGFYRSTDEGMTWSNISIPIMGNIIRDVHIDLYKNLFVGTKSGLFFSSTFGNTWTQIFTSSSNSDVRRVYLDNSNKIYISVIDSSINLANRSVLQSSNGGTSWSVIDSGIIGYSRIKEFSTDTSGNVYGLAGEGLITYDILYKWNSDSIKWLNVCNFPSSIIVNKIKHLSNNEFVASTSDGMFFSSDSGLNWSALGLYPKPCISLDITASDEILVGTSNSGTYYLSNISGTWINNQITIPRNPYQIGNIPDPIYSIAKSDNGKIFIGTRDSGIYRSDIVMGILDKMQNSDFTVYPNPFNDYIILKSNTSVKNIQILNLLGGIVYDEKDITVNSDQYVDLKFLPSGVFFILIENTFHQIYKIKLLKI